MTDKARELLERTAEILELLFEGPNDVDPNTLAMLSNTRLEEIRAYLAAEEGEQEEEPVAFLYDVDAYCDHRPDQNVLAKKLPTGLQDYLKNIRPLFLHPSPQAEQSKPLSKEDLEAGWKSYRMTRLDIYLEQRSFVAGIRFAEKHHGIGGDDE